MCNPGLRIDQKRMSDSSSVKETLTRSNECARPTDLCESPSLYHIMLPRRYAISRSAPHAVDWISEGLLHSLFRRGGIGPLKEVRLILTCPPFGRRGNVRNTQCFQCHGGSSKPSCMTLINVDDVEVTPHGCSHDLWLSSRPLSRPFYVIHSFLPSQRQSRSSPLRMG